VKIITIVVVAVFWSLFLGSAARADEVVKIGAGYALLNKPERPRASVILVPGGDGYLGIGANGRVSAQERSTLVRNRKALVANGLATLLIDAKIGVGQAAVYMKDVAQPIVIVAISRGGNRISEIIQARPSGIVLISAELDNVRRLITPQSLPQTLIIHHQNDNCHSTPARIVEPFREWSRGRARVIWVSGGKEIGNPCYGESYHGLLGRDDVLNSAVASFAVDLPSTTPAATNPVSNSSGLIKDAKGPSPKSIKSGGMSCRYKAC